MMVMMMMILMMMMMVVVVMLAPLRRQSFPWSVQALAGAGGSSVLPMRGTDF